MERPPLPWSEEEPSEPAAPPWSPGPRRPDVPALLATLDVRGATAVRHAVTTFTEHLFRTWRLLDRWGQPPALCAAGLLHSAYGSDAHDVALFGAEDRESLRAAIGARGERLVHLFCTVDRARLYAETATATALPRRVEVVHWRTGQQTTLPADEVADLLVLEVANHAEQSHGGALTPGLWVGRCAHWAALAASAGRELLPPFRAGEAPAPADEARARALYLSALARMDDAPAAALGELAEASRCNRLIGEPLVVAAKLTADAGDGAAARRLAGRGLALLTAWGTAWDKRGAWEQWVELAARLAGRH